MLFRANWSLIIIKILLNIISPFPSHLLILSSSQILLCCVCPGDPTALDLQDQPFHVLQQFTVEVDVEVGHLKAQNLDLGGSDGSQPVSSLALLPSWPALLLCPGKG